MTRDYRDLALEDAALALALAGERIVSLEADVGVYRELTQAAFDALRDLTVRLNHVTADRDRLRDQYRALREACLLHGDDDEDEAAAA